MNFKSVVDALCGPEGQKHFIKIWMVFSLEGKKLSHSCNSRFKDTIIIKINFRSGLSLPISF